MKGPIVHKFRKQRITPSYFRRSPENDIFGIKCTIRVIQSGDAIIHIYIYMYTYRVIVFITNQWLYIGYIRRFWINLFFFFLYCMKSIQLFYLRNIFNIPLFCSVYQRKQPTCLDTPIFSLFESETINVDCYSSIRNKGKMS